MNDEYEKHIDNTFYIDGTMISGYTYNYIWTDSSSSENFYFLFDKEDEFIKENEFTV
jgi:hypothetical protein